MMKNRKTDKKRLILTVLLTAGISVMLLLLAVLSAAGWKYYKISSSEEKVQTLEKSPAVPGEVTLGENFALKVKYRVPWGTQETENAFLTVPENMLVTSPPYFRTLQYSWGYRTVEGIYPLQAFADGKSGKGVIIARFRNKNNVESTLEEKIPEITVLPLKVTAGDLLTEGKIVAEKTFSLIPYIAIILVIVLVIAGLVFFLFRRKGGAAARLIPPWEQAVNAIGLLLQKVRAGDTKVEQSIAELSDIVRAYMEQRFSIRAEHQTSDEFFFALNSKKDILTPLQQEFLRKFIRSADLVKFARLAADITLVEDAAYQAEELVRETIPAEEEKKEKTEKKGVKEK